MVPWGRSRRLISPCLGGAQNIAALLPVAAEVRLLPVGVVTKLAGIALAVGMQMMFFWGGVKSSFIFPFLCFALIFSHKMCINWYFLV